MSARQPRFNQHLLIDTTPLPDSIPKVQEVGSSSAPLLSASYFIGARCKAYNDDYMQCKTEANGKGEMDCLREGRKVTRCAGSVYVLPLLLGSRRLNGIGWFGARASRAWLV
ncbi:ndufa8, NADH-ubiquinone oxidoreductase complex I 19kd subunit [Friedmanniomyces endolithicus]|nr:ndufa8, NADH-ubiquinone oxidoreductase complex I 19kd subunit [Friedmanniomyces endolithicus]KAK0923447.1 ndufa8, NADH-ubiquinone oxidoreductase complex I 19kd subunit [Friedmanniomyces endolithicus]KAK0960655.1 ndufa8, NADH-ubiquinone oxidoreductase complex I 19kd subunit [Friedmanniomyces endolithicus]